ncbi:MAG TPA: FAD-binding protein [Myxococcota bacterium]|nr:FAD-binding protein [Myxococcota bacterium]
MRVVVIGSGLAGAAAALELASREMKVTLVSAGVGATALSFGSLDVAVPSPEGSGLPLRDATATRLLAPRERLAACLRTRLRHPYATLFGRSGGGAAESAATDAVKSAAASLDRWLAPSGLRVEGGLDAARLLANVHGAVRACDFAFTGPAEGDLQGAAEVEIAAVTGLAQHDARPLARALAAEFAAIGLPRPSFRVVPLPLPAGFVVDGGSPARVAARTDTEEGLRALVAAVAARHRDETLGRRAEGERRLLLLPPILGFSGVLAKLTRLREAAGCRVAECLGAPPASPAGLRLAGALAAALSRESVVVRHARVRTLERTGRQLRALRLQSREASSNTEERLEAEVILLACGRFLGGGLSEHEGGVHETLLDLPLYDEAGVRVDGSAASRLVRASPEGPQRLFSSGVRTDSRLRPLGADGEPLFENLFVAGDLIGGFDPSTQRTGLGVALLTGLRAASEIARLAEQESA